MAPRDLIEKDLVIMSLPQDLKAEVVGNLEHSASSDVLTESRSRLDKDKQAELDKLLGVVDQNKIDAFLIEQVPQYFSLVSDVTKRVLERFKISLKEATEINMQVSAQNQVQNAEAK